MPDESKKRVLYCSFCGKSQHEVKNLIAGPTVFICDECVVLCLDTIAQKGPISFIGFSAEGLTSLLRSLQDHQNEEEIKTIDITPNQGEIKASP